LKYEEDPRCDAWANFYGRLKEIKDYHFQYTAPNSQIEYQKPDWYIENCFRPPFGEPVFSGEEMDGKYVDMEIFYHEY
jgi:splicing factor 3A subunit 3